MKLIGDTFGFDELKLNHIGLVVDNIEAAANALCLVGLQKRTLPEKDHTQKVNAVFIEVVPEQDLFIELLEPTAEDSPITPS